MPGARICPRINGGVLLAAERGGGAKGSEAKCIGGGEAVVPTLHIKH